MRVTDRNFAARAGCDFTVVSRLRNGRRRPTITMLHNIVKAYGLDPLEALEAAWAGPEAFGVYVRERIFNEVRVETLPEPPVLKPLRGQSRPTERAASPLLQILDTPLDRKPRRGA